MSTSPKPPYFLGIAGGSASGKTTLLKRLLEHFPGAQLTLISQDNYYRDRGSLPRSLDGEINFDHPDAVDLDTLARDLQRVAAGETVSIQEYTFNNPNIVPKTISYAPAPIVVVEGLFVLSHPALSAMLDLKVFVDADEHIRLSRRIRRDFEERGYTMDQVLDYYERFVVPMYRQYIEPNKYDCDIIIPNNLHMQRAVTVLMHHLDAITKAR
jgi:uridine kinase